MARDQARRERALHEPRALLVLRQVLHTVWTLSPAAGTLTRIDPSSPEG